MLLGLCLGPTFVKMNDITLLQSYDSLDDHAPIERNKTSNHLSLLSEPGCLSRLLKGRDLLPYHSITSQHNIPAAEDKLCT